MTDEDIIRQLDERLAEMEATVHASARLLAVLSEKVAMLLAERAEWERRSLELLCKADDGLSRH